MLFLRDFVNQQIWERRATIELMVTIGVQCHKMTAASMQMWADTNKAGQAKILDPARELGQQLNNFFDLEDNLDSRASQDHRRAESGSSSRKQTLVAMYPRDPTTGKKSKCWAIDGSTLQQVIDDHARPISKKCQGIDLLSCVDRMRRGPRSKAELRGVQAAAALAWNAAARLPEGRKRIQPNSVLAIRAILPDSSLRSFAVRVPNSRRVSRIRDAWIDSHAQRKIERLFKYVNKPIHYRPLHVRIACTTTLWPFYRRPHRLRRGRLQSRK